MRTLADVTVSFHTLGEVDLPTRAAAASAAGFRRIGLSIRRTRAWLLDHPLSELTDLLEGHDLVVSELESLRPLAADPDPHQDFGLGLAHDLQVPLIQVLGPVDGTVLDGAARLAALADRAAEVGARVSLEFLPWTNVPTVAAAAELVALAGRSNAGICVDSWHLQRSGGAVEDISQLWSHVASIQLNDGPLVSDLAEDLYVDCLHNRRLPGEGEFDIVRLLGEAEREAPGYSLSLEVISDPLRELRAGEAARLAAAATLRTLASVTESLSV